MKNKYVSLFELTKLVENEELSKKYINYMCGFDCDHQYRHDEIVSISTMLNFLELKSNYADGYIYGYSVPQLNKEFDLLKITKDSCLNIEIKSHVVSEEKIKKQLIQNKHYLNMLGKNVLLISFISETNVFYRLTNDEKIERIEKDTLLNMIYSLFDWQDINLDNIFKPSNILVSPLNEPDKFYNGQYLLTENQEIIKRDLIAALDKNNSFFGLTGGPGTGKTLLLYDIAFNLAKKGKDVMIIHSGIMCSGHIALTKKMSNLKIVEAKSLRYREAKGHDIILVDESQRIYISIIEKIEKWSNKTNAKCIFSFDESQTMSKTEERRNTPFLIRKMCKEYVFKLTSKIRTNKEIALFITCLRDLSKYKKEYHFDNVSIIYEPNNLKAVSTAKDSENEGYTYISYTSSYYDSSLDYQANNTNTHRVIGQEFDGVVMILNNEFFYDGNILCARRHPNSDYLYTQLLYQGLTRSRTKLRLIVQTEDLLSKIITMFHK